MKLKNVVETFVHHFLMTFTLPPIDFEEMKQYLSQTGDWQLMNRTLDALDHQQRGVAIFLKQDYRVSINLSRRQTKKQAVRYLKGEISHEELINEIAQFNLNALHDDISAISHFYVHKVVQEAMSDSDYNHFCDLIEKVIRDAYLKKSGFADKAVYLFKNREEATRTLADAGQSELFIAANSEIEAEELLEYVGLTRDEVLDESYNIPDIDI